MLFRSLVNQLVRQAAGQQVVDEVSRAAQQAMGRTEQQGQTAGQPGPPCQIAVIMALGVEAGGLVDLLEGCTTTRCAAYTEHAGLLGQRSIVVAESGVGRERAARAADDLIVLHRPAWVISAGFAGGLQPELRRGHFVMADEVVDQHDGRLTIGVKMDPQTLASTAGLHVGRLLTVDQLVRQAEQKRSLGQQHQALACDMETMAIAEVCRRCGTRFLSVRIISDSVEDELPHEIETLLEQKSMAAKLGAAAGAIFNRPSVVKQMWKLKEDAIRISDRLARFLTGVIAQLQTED